LIGLTLLVVPLTGLILAIIALVKLRRLRALTKRVAELESQLLSARIGLGKELGSAQVGTVIGYADRQIAEQTGEALETPEAPVAGPIVASAGETSSSSAGVESESSAPAGVTPSPAEPFAWETFIGQKAFGWVAVLLFVFAVAFFLRYAYQNNWIGPVGRVSIGALTGIGLALLGVYYYLHDWPRFSRMLTTAGVVAMYLATYSSFAFYRLLPQQHATWFLTALILESMVLAVVYRSTIIAIAAVIGGLMTPILMSTEHDQYQAFFIYLIVLNLGVAVSLTLRSWIVVGTLAYAGTQWLFWNWYALNYHPEKFGWALGFQSGLFGLFVGQMVGSTATQRRRANWEELVRCVANASIGFGSFYILTADDYRIWSGTAALTVAALYALVTRCILAWRADDQRLLLTTLATAMGFVAWAIPIQAEARWVPLGWTVMGAVLYWFGHRVAAPLMRWMAAVLLLLAVGRLIVFELPLYTRDPFWPVFNRFALPSLSVATVILVVVRLTRAKLRDPSGVERFLIGAVSTVGLLLIWLVLSIDCFGYFDSQSIGSENPQEWRWRGQLALSLLWAAYASLLLGAGFRLKLSRLRWLAIALFAVTVVKLFLVDMAHVQQLYRILAFFGLAVVLALVARVYQRLR
jgi:uncharacterized membrane protein